LRKALHYLFPLLALVVCVARPSRAEAPQLVACKDHVCVMSEENYRGLQIILQKMTEGALMREAEADHAEHLLQSCQAALRDVRS
jgi:hypothetical protein